MEGKSNEELIRRAEFADQDYSRIAADIQALRDATAEAEAKLEREAAAPGTFSDAELHEIRTTLAKDQPRLRERMDDLRAAERRRTEAKLAAKDAVWSRSGCFTAGVGAAAIAIVIGIAWILLNSSTGGDGDRPRSTEAAGAPVTTAAPSGDPTGDGDLSSFAGRWVLRSGLDDPSGIDVPEGPSTPTYAVTLGSSSAEIIIDERGVITGGVYRTSSSGAGGECPGPVTADADLSTASGNLTGPDGAGLVSWQGPVRLSGCFGASEVTTFTEPGGAVSLQLWISGDTMTLCRSPMASPTTCAEPSTRVVAVFTRS